MEANEASESEGVEGYRWVFMFEGVWAVREGEAGAAASNVGMDKGAFMDGAFGR